MTFNDSNYPPIAGMAELVDAYVSGAYARKGVGVRLPLPALQNQGLMRNSIGPFCFA